MMRLMAAFIRISRLQFVIISVVGFVVAYMASGEVSGWFMALGVLQITLAKVADGMINAYSDRQEDQINLPDYSSEVRLLGYGRCLQLGVGLYGLCLVNAIILLFIRPVPVCLGLALGIVPALTYSVGPRLKQHSFLSPLWIFLWAAGPILVGWTLGQKGWIPLHVWIVFFLAGLFMATNRLTRYLNDIEGDLKANVDTLFTKLSLNPRLWTWQGIMALPYLLTGLLVLTELASPRYLWLLGCWPLGIVLVAMLCRARDAEQRAAVWDWATVYATLTHVAVLVAFFPQPFVWVLALSVIASRLLLSELKLDYRARLPMARLLVIMRDLIEW